MKKRPNRSKEALERERARRNTPEYREENRRRAKTWREKNHERYLAGTRRWREAHPNYDHARYLALNAYYKDHAKNYYAENKTRLATKYKKWAEENRVYDLARKRRYYSENKEKERARFRAWKKANPGYDGIKKAVRRGQLNAGNVTAGELRAVRALYGTQCLYCGAAATAMDHVIPLARGGAHAASNLVPACTTCNSRKRDSLPLEFFWGMSPKRPRRGLAQSQPAL